VDQMTPALTSVAIPKHELGLTAAVMLLALLDGEPARRILLPVQLVVRGSTRERARLA
jgi:LacI family transcriptional regulator